MPRGKQANGEKQDMKKKTAIVSVLLGVLVIGLVSAGLVPYLSNMVSGIVTVEGPVFYATKNVFDADLGYYSLSINEFDGESGKYVMFTNGLESQWFVSEELGINSFYPANYNFDVEICAENKTVNDTIGQVTLTLKILKENGDFREDICEAYVNNIPTIDSCVEANYNDYQSLCSAEELYLEPTDRFVLITSDGAHAITYYIRLDEDTKIEVTPTE